MSSPHDDTPPPTWTAPGSAVPPSKPGPSQPAPPAPTGPPPAPYPGPPPNAPAAGWTTQPAWNGQPGWAAPPPGGWRPPALQPGIIPLRPLGLGEILDGAFKSIRANPRVMFGLSAIVAVVAVTIQSVLTWYLGGILTDSLGDALSTSLENSPFAEEASLSLGSTIASLLTVPITSLATSVLTGWLIVSVSRSVIGQKVGAADVLRNKKIWSVVGFTALVAAVSLAAAALVLVPVVLLARSDQLGAAVGLGLLGSIALFVVLVWVGIRTLLVPAALMLEGKTFGPTVARAWRLTRGSFWRLLGIYLLVSILVAIVSELVAAPAVIISMLVFADADATSLGTIIVTGIADIIAFTLGTAFLAAVVALLYVDVRMRREGLDVELARASDPTR